MITLFTTRHKETLQPTTKYKGNRTEPKLEALHLKYIQNSNQPIQKTQHTIITQVLIEKNKTKNK